MQRLFSVGSGRELVEMSAEEKSRGLLASETNDSLLPSTRNARVLAPKIIVSKEAASIALKNGLKLQRDEYLARLRQLERGYERQRLNAEEETMQLQQTLKLVRDEFEKTETERVGLERNLRAKEEQIENSETEIKSLREIVAAMSNELASMRVELRLYRKHGNDDGDGTRGDEKGDSGMIRLADLPSVEEIAAAEASKSEKDSSSGRGDGGTTPSASSSSRTPTPRRGRQSSILDTLGLNFWGASTAAPSTPPGSPSGRSRRRSVSDPALSPSRNGNENDSNKPAAVPPLTPRTASTTIGSLKRQLSALRDEHGEFQLNHRCEVQSLREIVKAMSFEVDNLKSEKQMLKTENGRLMEEIMRMKAAKSS